MECISIEKMLEWNTAHNSRVKKLESVRMHTHAITFTHKLNNIHRRLLDLTMEMNGLVYNENYFRAKDFHEIHKADVFGKKLFMFWDTIRNNFHSHIETLTNLTRWMPYEKSGLAFFIDFEE